MAVKLPGGLDITVAEPVDTRIVLTKAEMAALKKGTMPDKYICICKDNGKLYIYDKTKEADPEIGRFTLLEDQIDMEGEKFRENLDKAVAENIEAGSESTKAAVQAVVDEAVDKIIVDGGFVE